MTQTMTVKTLHHQNLAFVGTGGISPINRKHGFSPAFMDRATGIVYLSRKADGSPAPIHILDGLPDELVRARTISGQVAAIKGTVVAGFMMDDQFYTRAQAALMLE